MVWVCGMPWCAEINYHTCTRKTHDLIPAGFPIPMTIPTSRWRDGVKQRQTVHPTSVGAAPAPAATAVGVVVVGGTLRTNEGQCEQVQTSRPGAQ